jgi:hypothetical protein
MSSQSLAEIAKAFLLQFYFYIVYWCWRQTAHLGRDEMDITVTSDIFKLLALRAPQNFDYQKDHITIIRDNRIQDTYLPDETHDVGADQTKFSNSMVAQFVFQRIDNYLSEVSSNKDVVSLNEAIADDVKNQFTVNECTGRPWLDAFVSVIKKHTGTFNKANLLAELDVIIRKQFPEYTGIRDYVGVAVADNTSSFCQDFDYLFERLYALYVCKRKYPINLEYVLDGLKALHIIRFLKIELDDQPQNPLGVLKGCLFALLSLLRIRRMSKTAGVTPVVTVEQDDRVRTDCATRQLTEDGTVVAKAKIETAGDLANLFGATPYLHQLFSCLLGYYKPFNDIRPIGIGDLLVVKQFLCKYEAGEIAHVENVLKGESKDRSHRRLDRSEDILTLLTERTEETEKELQTTDRFELKKETENTIQNDLKIESAGTVSGKYGVVEYTASAGFSYSLSTNDSRRNANNFAKDIVDRSLTRVQKRTREEQTTRRMNEVEEINKHGLNNTTGSGHITGLYRWLTKHYKAQIYNYGKRLMFEFVVPEPAAFIAAAFERNRKTGNRPDRPQKPPFPALVISQISDATVNTYAERYNIDDLEPEPAATITVRSQPMAGKDDSTREFILDIPSGYEVKSAKVAGSRQRVINPIQGYVLNVNVGEQVKNLPEDAAEDEKLLASINADYMETGPIREKLSIAVLSYGIALYSFSVVVTVNLTREKKREWQLKTYKRIMDAYEKLLAEYNAALAEYQDKLEGYQVSQGIIIQGRNLAINQEIIRTELKKHCITMIAKQFDVEKGDDIVFNSMKSRQEQIDEETTVQTETKKVTQTTPAPGTTVTVTETTITASMTVTPINIDIPAIDIPDARQEGSIIQFLEQAFEWQQISYLLYPYFWGRMAEKWFDAQKYYGEEDPLFAKFLQAGSARVLVAVRPAYEVAVLHYLCTKKPWNGGPAPGIHHPLYIPIYEELRNQQDDLNGAVPYGEPWDVIVPTSLVYLQADSTLPSFDCNPLVRK